jgi:hypothetical protein
MTTYDTLGHFLKEMGSRHITTPAIETKVPRFVSPVFEKQLGDTLFGSLRPLLKRRRRFFGAFSEMRRRHFSGNFSLSSTPQARFIRSPTICTTEMPITKRRRRAPKPSITQQHAWTEQTRAAAHLFIYADSSISGKQLADDLKKLFPLISTPSERSCRRYKAKIFHRVPVRNRPPLTRLCKLARKRYAERILAAHANGTLQHCYFTDEKYFYLLRVNHKSKFPGAYGCGLGSGRP